MIHARHLKHALRTALVLGALCLSACVPRPDAKITPREPDVTGPLSSISNSWQQVQEVWQEATSPSVAQSPVEVKIGLLLPLSGASADVGKQLQDAATLAVFDAKIDNQRPVNITLIPKDTSTSATLAGAAASEAMAQGAQALVGPMFSQSVAEVGARAKPRGVPVVALTNNRQVASAGTTVFGFTPEDQVNQVVTYALRRGASHVALLAPADAYGTVVESALRQAVSSQGGVLTSVQRYGKRPEHVTAAAQRIIDDFRVQPFKALMIADSPAVTSALVKELRARDFSLAGIMLLGTGLLGDMGDKPDPNLLGMMYATTNPANYVSFERRFQATFGYQPKRIASLAYDAVMVAATLAPAGTYSGRATGAFRILPSGITERSLAIVSVAANGFNIVQPAPREMKESGI